MRAVVQRVKESSVTAQGKIIAKIDKGLLVLLGIAKGDTTQDAVFLADKVVHLRIFEDDNGKMNLSLLDTGTKMIVVSQFTLLGDCRKGRRPSFINAADPKTADSLYQYFVSQVRRQGVAVQTGRFRAMMDVSLVNDGPVTLILDSNS